MSTDAVNAQEAGPVAMGTYDSSVYLAWIKAMADVLMSHSDQSVRGDVISNYGGLMMALTESAEELIAKEKER